MAVLPSCTNTLHRTENLKYYKYLGPPFLRNTAKLNYQHTDIVSVVSKVWGANRLGVEGLVG
jgi:hypothetical protein